MSAAKSLCHAVNFGSVGESGFQSVVSHVVSGPTQKIMVVRTVRSSLCPNTGASALLVANGATLAQGDITHVGSAIQALVAPNTRVTAIVHTYPLNNGIVCPRLGELEYELQECQLELSSSAASDRASKTKSVEATSAAEAATKAFGEAGNQIRAGFTSHFNFDNRVFASDPNPPTTNKYYCLVECKLVDGSTSWFYNDDLRVVHVGELDVLQIDSFHRHVVKCRFWWRLNPQNQSYSSDWVVADPGNYIVYAFLVWHANNDYERPIYNYQEPIN